MVKRKFDHISFDMDGTLADSVVPHNQFCIDMAQRFNMPISYPVATDLDAWKNLVAKDFRTFFLSSGYNESQADEIFRIYKTEFPNNPHYEVRLYPGVKAFLGRLSSSGRQLSLVSHNVRENVMPIIQKSGVGFEPVYCREELDEKYQGNKAGAIAEIKSQFGCNGNMVYVGDMFGDFQASQIAGVHFEGVSWGWVFRGKEQGISISKSLAELEARLTL